MKGLKLLFNLVCMDLFVSENGHVSLHVCLWLYICVHLWNCIQVCISVHLFVCALCLYIRTCSMNNSHTHTVLPNPNWLTIFSRGRSCQLPGRHRPNSTWPLQLEVLINVVRSMPTCNSYTHMLYNVRWWGALLCIKKIIINNDQRSRLTTDL